MDPSQIYDDEGGVPKTVSVENSFRRGTLVTQQRLSEEMEQLYRRLPRLLLERQEWSISPRLAYPTKVRLTLRTVDEQLVLTRRRPFVTRSKQRLFDGKAFARINDTNQRASFLRKALVPLLQAFGLKSDQINVTRVNIAVTDFQDISARQPSSSIRQSQTCQSKLSAFITRTKTSSPNNNQAHLKLPRVKAASTGSSLDEQASTFHRNDMNPSILAQLTPDTISESRRAKPQKRKRIDEYFTRRSKS